MNTVVNLTLEGRFISPEGTGIFWNPDNAATIMANADSVSQIKLNAFSSDGSDYYIKWENCNNEYFEYHHDLLNPVIQLDVVDESKPVTFSYYHEGELVGKIDIDPLHNNGVTISGTKSDFRWTTEYASDAIEYSVFENLNDINNVIHVNELAII